VVWNSFATKSPDPRTKWSADVALLPGGNEAFLALSSGTSFRIDRIDLSSTALPVPDRISDEAARQSASAGTNGNTIRPEPSLLTEMSFIDTIHMKLLDQRLVVELEAAGHPTRTLVYLLADKKWQSQPSLK
jgi:hypothetical protein